MLAQVPGISPATARRLLDRFGSVNAIASASAAELEEIPGIGARRAATLRRVLAGV